MSDVEKRVVYLQGPAGELVTLQDPDPEMVEKMAGEGPYELLTRDRFNEIAATRLRMRGE